MKSMGFGNAVIFDANGASQNGNDPVPPGPTFGTPEWREFYKHANPFSPGLRTAL